MYNKFRKLVFAELHARGESVHDLIEAERARDKTGKMTYDEASREVVAEAMTDILPETSFMKKIAEKDMNLFRKLVERFKEFVDDLKAHFNSLADNPSREANALKEQIGDTVRYAENIVKMFDEVAVQAVENYQATVATDENVKVTKEKDNVERGKENTQRPETVHRRRDSGDEGKSQEDKGARSDRSGIQENAGKFAEDSQSQKVRRINNK